MLELVLSTRFKKDLKLAKKRGLDLNLMDEVVTTVASCQTLDEKYSGDLCAVVGILSPLLSQGFLVSY